MKCFKTVCLAITLMMCVSAVAAAFPPALPAGAAARGKISRSIPVNADGILTLDAQTLEERLGIPFDGVTVTALPARGALLLGEEPVRRYEYIPRAALLELRFLPDGNAGQVTLGLLPQAREAVTANLSIMMLSTPNSPPILEGGNITTAPGVMVKGRLGAYDPDGDALEALLVQKPKKGSVRFDGLYYIYEPYPNAQGGDRFTVYVVDSAGNYSDTAAIEVSVEEGGRAQSFAYADMNGNPSHYAAIGLYQRDIYQGRRIGERSFFFPERMMPRSDYLMLLLAASGRTPLPAVNTGLPNDAGIPMWLKPYVKAGLDAGILLVEEGFDPNGVPTRAEAVVWCARAAQIDDVKEYPLTMGDADEIPRWARQSYVDLAAYRMLDLYEDKAMPNGLLTNAYAVDLAWQLCKYYEADIGK